MFPPLLLASSRINQFTMSFLVTMNSQLPQAAQPHPIQLVAFPKATPVSWMLVLTNSPCLWSAASMASTSSTVTHWQTLSCPETKQITMLSTPSRDLSTQSQTQKLSRSSSLYSWYYNSSLTNYLIDTCENRAILSQSSTRRRICRIRIFCWRWFR